MIPDFELEQVFLSFGERMKILKPDNFREKINKRIESSIKNYFN